MEIKLECDKDLEHFNTSLLVNEEDTKGMLNIKQEVYCVIYWTLSWQVVSLEKRRSGNEWLPSMLIPLYNLAQANAFCNR